MRAFTYRVDLFGYRLSNLLDLFFQLAVWFAVFQTTTTVRGYNYHEMVTYVIISWLFIFLTSNYDLESFVRRDIYDGNLTNFITKPISYLRYIVALSIGRASLALLSGAIVQITLILILKNQLTPLPGYISIFIIFLMITMGYFIRLFLSILTGLLTFWIHETGGVNKFFDTFIRFFSGGYMPLTILPILIYKLSLFFPFAYLIFIPMQLYLGKISVSDGLKGLGVELLWLVTLYGIIKLIWHKGIKRYEGVGI